MIVLLYVSQYIAANLVIMLRIAAVAIEIRRP